MKVTFVALTVLIVLTVSLSAIQTAFPLKVDGAPSINVLPAKVAWAKTYGGEADDRAFSSAPSGRGFLVVGSSSSIVANTTVGWALNLDLEGNVVWNKTFLEGFGTELRCAVNLTDGFLLVGNEFLASGDVNGYVAKADSQGNLLWKTILTGGSTNKLFSGIATSDGFVVFGLIPSNSNGTSAAWVVKLDLSGNIIWNKTFSVSVDSALRAGVLAQDGDYVIAGYAATQGDSNYAFYLLKVDPNGNLVWNKTYGGTESEKAYSIAKAPDGYVLVGDVESPTSSTDAWVLKVDTNGNALWNRTVGGKDADSPAYITPSTDGGYLVAGFTFSFGEGQRDFWLFKITDEGQVLFSCTQGTEAFQEAYSVTETGNNQFLMVGWTDPLGHPDLIGKKLYDFYVVELGVSQNSGTFSSFKIFIYAATVIAALMTTLLLVLKLRAKGKRYLKLL